MRNLVFLFVAFLFLACDPEPKKEKQVEATPENTTKLEPITPQAQGVDSTNVDKAPGEIVPKVEME